MKQIGGSDSWSDPPTHTALRKWLPRRSQVRRGRHMVKGLRSSLVANDLYTIVEQAQAAKDEIDLISAATDCAHNDADRLRLWIGTPIAPIDPEAHSHRSFD